MKLSNLKPAENSVKKGKRIARGEGSGMGGTATRGHKGAQSRSGYKSKAGFEGGQMPLQRRTPKRGFKNFNRTEYAGVNLDALQYFAEKYNWSKVDKDLLVQAGVVHKNDLVKILGRGELKTGLEVTADAFSANAKEAIEKAGGQAILVS